MKTKRKHNGGYVVQKYQHVDSQLEKLSSILYKTEEEKLDENQNGFLRLILINIYYLLVSLLFVFIIEKLVDSFTTLLILGIGGILWCMSYQMVKMIYKQKHVFLSGLLLIMYIFFIYVVRFWLKETVTSIVFYRHPFISCLGAISTSMMIFLHINNLIFETLELMKMNKFT